ncbi:MAG: Holliday junction resolvase RuvX, partial [Parcubacteria group bacterium]|nr:Holliday junction resolvase RuvX [Parcubacteria group bacterium]
MRILGVDFGEKHLGIAIGDTATGLVAPFGYFEVRSKEEAIEKIRAALLEAQASKIVFGLPLSFRFRKTKASEIVKSFAEEVRKALGVEIVFENEILTSELAKRYLGYETGRRRKDSRNHAFAAALILESY